MTNPPLAMDKQTKLPDLAPCVRRFVGELAPAYREALVLTEWHGLPDLDVLRLVLRTQSRSNISEIHGSLSGAENRT